MRPAVTRRRAPTPARCVFATAALIALGAQAAPQADGKLGRGLGELVGYQARTHADLAQAAAREALRHDFDKAAAVQLDAAGRVLVDVHLDGRRSLDDVLAASRQLGLAVRTPWAHYHQGAFSAWLPLAKAAELSQLPGVRSVLLAPAPLFSAGKVQSQGVALMHADAAQSLGFDGTGITVGAMSDSYDESYSRPITYSQTDIKTGDLPGKTNPDGYKSPVIVVQDSVGENEGRAMLQIVHDVAPAAKLCFGTAEGSEFDFAATIQALVDTTHGGECGADILVDDVIYYTEPMFEDGLVAQQVDAVVAQGVSYFSSAGNQPPANGYSATFSAIPDATARAQTTDIALDEISPSMTQGGFHNFAALTGGSDIEQTITVDGAGSNIVVLQWDDPFDSPNVSTDYDLYAFRTTDGQLTAVSDEPNAQTGEPLEYIILGPGTYKLVVARADTNGTVPEAQHLRWVVYGDVASTAYAGDRTPAATIYGHAAADGAIAVGAVPFYAPYIPEAFTGNGPSTIALDATGARLPQPVVRNKPEISAPDGVNTTFFPPTTNAKGRTVPDDSPEDADTYANFFGTSAAAPHAAAVGALLMQKAGGRTKLPPANMKLALETSAQPHDLQPGFARADATTGKATVHVTATGQGLSGSDDNPNAFNVTLQAPKGWTLQSLTLDLSTANASRQFLGVAAPGLDFDPAPADLGYPLTYGALTGLAATDVTASPLASAPPLSQQLSFAFAAARFTPAASFSFGVGRKEVAGVGDRAGNADQLAGGTIAGTVLDAKGASHAFSATFTNGGFGSGWNPVMGYGLIDAVQALGLVSAPAAR